MANSRRASNGLVSPLSALKISLVLVAAISLFFFAKLSIPHISTLLSVALPQIWAVFLAWLAPPYLFITVHLIILVIWKLSDQKPSRDHLLTPHQDQPVVKPKQQLPREISTAEISRDATQDNQWVPSGEPAVPKHDLGGEISPAISRKEPRHVQWAPLEEQTMPMRVLSSPKNSLDVLHRLSRSDESILTEEKSEEKLTASSHLEMRRSEKPQLAPEREIVRPLEGEQEEPVVVEEGEADMDDDSMEATWKAIMEKTPRPVVPTPSQAREPEISVGADEMNRRFEDFIKKSRDQIRLQVEEPSRLHGRLPVANAAF